MKNKMEFSAQAGRLIQWLFILAAVVVLRLPVRADESVPVTPADHWKVVTKEGDVARLENRGGILHVAYDVRVNQMRRVGHVTKEEASFTIELNQPIALREDQARFYFESRLMGGAGGKVSVRPLIVDEHGERISYEPFLMKPFQKNLKVDMWKAYKTQALLMTEAGGATQNIYDAEGGDLNSWPDGKLSLIGFQIRVNDEPYKPKPDRQVGQFQIANLTIGSWKVSPESFAFADSLFPTKGKYTVCFELSAAFQGKPIREVSESVDFDPANDDSTRQRIRMPVEALHSTWVRYRVKDDSGKMVLDDSSRWDQDIPPGIPSTVQGVDMTKRPLIGQIRVNPDRSEVKEAGGVYAAGEPLAVVLRVFQPINGKGELLKLDWQLTPYAFTTPLAQGTQEVAFNGKPYVDVTVSLPEIKNRDAYHLQYKLNDLGGGKLDEGLYTVGIRHSSAVVYEGRKGAIPDRAEIKKYPYTRVTFTPNEDRRDVTEKALIEQFRTMLGESKQMVNHVTYMVDLSNFEILPGVYDFSVMDQVMDLAADAACGITVRLAHGEHDSPYLWMPYTIPRNFDGTPLEGFPFYGSFSLTDPQFVDAWMRAFKMMHDRYVDHPAFEGYYIMNPSGEWTLPDEPWNGYICGYSWPEICAFRKYLKEQLGLDLKGLNARWHTSFKSWDDVQPPQPDLKAGSRPDLRPQWVDFSRCKISWKNSWFVSAAKHIRSFDPNHVIIAYDGYSGAYQQMQGLVDYLHNGGNTFLQGEGYLVNAWDQGRLGWITEPNQPYCWAAYGDPGSKGWVLDWSVYVMTAQAGAGGQNLHIYYHPNPTLSLAAHYGGAYAYDRLEAFKPIMRELHGSKLVEVHKQIAVIQDMDTVLTKHRTTFEGRLSDLRRWFELLKMDSLDFEDYRPERESDYRMVVLNPLDEVSSQSSIEAMNRMVRNGAWLVMSAGSAKYCPDQPSKLYPLLEKLEIQSPHGAFEMNEESVQAKLEKGQKILGSRDEIPFFTQGDMRRQIKDPAVAKEFWRWPYRWIPQTDYFGYYKANTVKGGEVVARFSDGGVAVSLHSVGKGKVLVFWGTPDMNQLKGMMSEIATQAGVVNSRAGNPIPLMLEADREDLKRHYAMLYSEGSGPCIQKIPNAPDGELFIDDMVSGQRFGTFRGDALRNTGLPVNYVEGCSPLKVLRMIPVDRMKVNWLDQYPRTK